MCYLINMWTIQCVLIDLRKELTQWYRSIYIIIIAKQLYSSVRIYDRLLQRSWYVLRKEHKLSRRLNRKWVIRYVDRSTKENRTSFKYLTYLHVHIIIRSYLLFVVIHAQNGSTYICTYIQCLSITFRWKWVSSLF